MRMGMHLLIRSGKNLESPLNTVLKNKKAIYILLPLNLFIWVFFVYRFYSAFHEPDLPASAEASVSKSGDLSDSGSYVLSMDYKDPFLKDLKPRFNTLSEKDKLLSSSKNMKNSRSGSKVPALPKQLPEIKYLGTIKNNISGLSTALVSINGESKLVKQNESIGGIVFKSFNKDSLVAKFGKDRIVARK